MSSKHPTLVLNTEEGQQPTILESTSLLVFIDESGDEGFSDDAHPIFGLAGCAVPVAEYATVIASPWKEIRARLFNGRASLHAADLRRRSQEQLVALASFFSDPRFGRFAAVATRSTIIPNVLHPYQLLATSLMRRIELLLSRFEFSRVALIIESSTRTNSLAERYFGAYQKVVIQENRRTSEVPIEHFLLPKRLNEPGLEVADFVANAVGGYARRSLANQPGSFGKDFEAIFHAVPREAVEFIKINSAETRDA